MSRITLGGALMVCWVLLWGSATPGTLIGGVLVISAMYWIFPSTRSTVPTNNFHPFAIVRLVAYFVKQLVVSNVLLSIELFRPQPAIRQVVVDVPMHSSSASVLTAVSNLCAMSPGTMVVGVNTEPPMLRIHVLVFGPHDDHEDAVRSIYDLERLVIESFGSGADRESLGQRPRAGGGAAEVVS